MMIMIIAAAPLAQTTARREAASRGTLLTERVSTRARAGSGAGALTRGASGSGADWGIAGAGCAAGRAAGAKVLSAVNSALRSLLPRS